MVHNFFLSKYTQKYFMWRHFCDVTRHFLGHSSKAVYWWPLDKADSVSSLKYASLRYNWVLYDNFWPCDRFCLISLFWDIWDILRYSLTALSIILSNFFLRSSYIFTISICKDRSIKFQNHIFCRLFITMYARVNRVRH